MARPRVTDISGADAKQRLVAAGTRVVLEHFAAEPPRLADGLRFASPSAIARKAGVSKAMIYHYWPDFSAFAEDVALEILDLSSEPEALELALPVSRDPADALEALAAVEVRRLRSSPAWRGSIVLAIHGVGNAIGDWMWDKIEATYVEVFDHVGLKRRAGIPMRSIAASLSAVAEGHALLQIESPDLGLSTHPWVPHIAGASPDVRQWTLHQINVDLVLAGLTERADPEI